jgi:hypothetical protein
VQVPNINTSFKIFVSSTRGNNHFTCSEYQYHALLAVLLIIIIIIILWQSLYLYQLDICIVLVSLLRRLLFMRFLDIRILCWFVSFVECNDATAAHAFSGYLYFVWFVSFV